MKSLLLPGTFALLGAALILSTPAPAQSPKPATTDTALTSQDREMLALATDFAAECSRVLEGWVASKAISQEKLFSRLYFAIPGTDPAKYNTDYDAMADKDIGPIQEKFLGTSNALVYVLLADINGYVPTHNLRFAQPLSGNRAVDLVNNRTKRIFLDRTGFAAARNKEHHLVQRYQRDTGERMADLSIPLMVNGAQFGCVRIGYRPAGS